MDTTVDMNQPLQGNFNLSELNKGRRIFDAVLEGLKEEEDSIIRLVISVENLVVMILQSLDGNIGRDIGIGSDFITRLRRGGG